jgi:hypothetical protein
VRDKKHAVHFLPPGSELTVRKLLQSATGPKLWRRPQHALCRGPRAVLTP